MTNIRTPYVLVAAFGAATLAFTPAIASARTPHSRHTVSQSGDHGSVQYAVRTQGHGYQPLVSDGPGSGLGFHHNPTPYRVGAAIARNRQVDSVRSAVTASAIDSQPHVYGLYGDSVYGNGNSGAYGVFNGADGYGSPYFAGYYGPADGEDYGVFGHAYTN